MQLSVSVHALTGMLAVGWSEPGRALPEEVRVVEYEVGELVAEGISARLRSDEATRAVASIDLDELVARAESMVKRRSTAPERA